MQLKLLATPAQRDALRRTLIRANAACDAISHTAWQAQTFRQFALHRLTYQAVRKEFGLAAQLVVRCIAKVAHAYKIHRKTQRTFQPLGAVAYDDRLLAIYPATSRISIWTLDGRQVIPFVCGPRQRELLSVLRGESDLAYISGQWYLFANVDVEKLDPISVEGTLGIDLGVANIATDSDGKIYSGRVVKNVRFRHRRLRQKLQKLGTLGSRRRLRKLAGQERRFATWVNHNLAKQIVATAEGTKRAIALENLTHIRTRITAPWSQRATLPSNPSTRPFSMPTSSTLVI